MRSGRDLLRDELPSLPDLAAIVADRGYGGLAALAAGNGLRLDIKKSPKGTSGFTPIAPLYKVEHAFARLGRWRRLSRCYEGTEASARAWLAVAATAYLLTRFRTTPPWAQGSQSPGVPGPGIGPARGGPDQMSIRPHERSTRAASPCDPSLLIITSPSFT